MNVKKLLSECLDAGVTVHLLDGTIRLRGTPDAIKTVSAKLRPYKAEILAYLTTAANEDPETWGPFTPWCAPISPALVRELHQLITQYAALYRLADDATARIIAAAKRQPASTIPAAIEFFQQSIKEKS